MDVKLVSDYTNMTFDQVLQLDCITFKILMRDAFIHMMSRSEEGRKYLEDCWVLTQTKPDTQKLRQRYERNST